MAELTMTRKADRAKMAVIIADLARSLGAEAVIHPDDPNGLYDGRLTRVAVTAARGLKVSVDFNGKSWQPDIYVLSWHMDLDTDACLDDSFGNINPFHFRKATYTADGFEHLKEQLSRGLRKAADGSAFNAEREAASIAKDGTWQERKERFRRGREEWEAQRAAKAAQGAG